jgi:hypothetical protein
LVKDSFISPSRTFCVVRFLRSCMNCSKFLISLLYVFYMLSIYHSSLFTVYSLYISLLIVSFYESIDFVIDIHEKDAH